MQLVDYEQHIINHNLWLLLKAETMSVGQAFCGNETLESTMIYTHVLKDISRKPESPLDML